MMRNERVCIVGLGYIGLPTAALISSVGYSVLGVDINPEVVLKINQGLVHIVEPELAAFVCAAVGSGRFRASLTPEEADIYIIAVPTPFLVGYKPDISYVESAVESIIPYLKSGNILILESTSPVGTTDRISSLINSQGINVQSLHIAYCPERVLPGKIMKELVENDRIVGGIRTESAEKVKSFYTTFVEGAIHTTSARTAEMAKLTENAYRDVNIAFANELSMICDKINVDVDELIQLANFHPRVDILKPSCGVGGHCIAVDPWFIVDAAPEQARLIKTARQQNLEKTAWTISKIKTTADTFESQQLRKPVIACLGLSYKPDTDDLRESPALHIVKALQSEINIKVVEPHVHKLSDVVLEPLDFAVNQADIVVILVGHKIFNNINVRKDQILLDFSGK